MVHTRRYKTPSLFHLPLPSMPGPPNQAILSIRVTSTNRVTPVPFFTLTLDFVLVLPLSKEGFYVIMSVTCKFSKRVTLIEGANTWSVEQWAHAFLKRLDFIDWGLPGELITDRDLKFLSKFWTALFAKLGVKLFYRTAYHPQTDGASVQTNQTVEIALQFFVHAMDDPFQWPEVWLPYNLCLITPPFLLPEKSLTRSPTGSRPGNLWTCIRSPPCPIPTSPIPEPPT